MTMSTTVTEVAPDIFRICTHVADFDLQFNQFLVRDDEPLLYHTGMKCLLPSVCDAVSSIIDPADVRWIGYSHFEVDECGALNDWLAIAPKAQAICGVVAGLVNLNDFADRPPRILETGEAVETGAKRFRYYPTPHLPHAWDAGMLYEETQSALFCSDLFHQLGDVEAVSETADVVGRFEHTLKTYNDSPFANYMPYTELSRKHLEALSALAPRVLLPMHGSAYRGDGTEAIRGLTEVMRREAVRL
jgi:flavorubredoxin